VQAQEVRELPEQKLAIQVTDVNGVHVDHMNVLESGEGKIR
jgi:hypothetical protein